MEGVGKARVEDGVEERLEGEEGEEEEETGRNHAEEGGGVEA